MAADRHRRHPRMGRALVAPPPDLPNRATVLRVEVKVAVLGSAARAVARSGCHGEARADDGVGDRQQLAGRRRSGPPSPSCPATAAGRRTPSAGRRVAPPTGRPGTAPAARRPGPPRMCRPPLRVPLSWANGASPARAGQPAAVERAQLGQRRQQRPADDRADPRDAPQQLVPLPPGRARPAPPRRAGGRRRPASASSQATCRSIPARTAASAQAARRLTSMTRISTSWPRRDSRASSARCSGAGAAGRGSGRTASAKWARASASIRSVLARRPVALAKSRAWRGLTAATGMPAACRAARAGGSYPPVASRTTRAGASGREPLDQGGDGRPGRWRRGRRPRRGGRRRRGGPWRRRCRRRSVVSAMGSRGDPVLAMRPVRPGDCSGWGRDEGGRRPELDLRPARPESETACRPTPMLWPLPRRVTEHTRATPYVRGASGH